MRTSPSPALISVVDDDDDFREILVEILQGYGFATVSFASGSEFIKSEIFLNRRCDLLITDIRMPGLNGFRLCEEVRSVIDHELLPIIMLTGADAAEEKSQGLNAGADDLIQKPFNDVDLLAKVNSLLGIKRQSLQKLKRVSKFISPNIAKLVVENNLEGKLKLHQAEVSVLFCDLRGFTAFTEQTDPAMVMEVLNAYYTAVGDSAQTFQATLGHLAGDGIMLFLNDPNPISDHQSHALRLAIQIRNELNSLKSQWIKNGYKIDFGIGLADGPATLGGIGYDQFSQYSVIGPVVNFASRLCHEAQSGQILVSHRFLSCLPEYNLISFHNLGLRSFRGIQKTVNIYEIHDLEDKLSTGVNSDN